MNTWVEKLVECLCIRHGMFREEAYSIVYQEWDYLESLVESSDNEKKLCNQVATELLEIYMVA